MVLFQDATTNKHTNKPRVSSSGISRSDQVLQKLRCQEVHLHFKPAVRPSLPPDMLLYSDEKETRLLDIDSARNEAFKKEFVISLIRLGHSNHSPHIWAAVHTLVSLTAVPFMRVGFLPVVPKPITDCATVRHCLTNFQSCR